VKRRTRGKEEEEEEEEARENDGYKTGLGRRARGTGGSGDETFRVFFKGEVCAVPRSNDHPTIRYERTRSADPARSGVGRLVL